MVIYFYDLPLAAQTIVSVFSDIIMYVCIWEMTVGKVLPESKIGSVKMD